MNNNKFIKKWERDRKKGKTVYVLVSCLSCGATVLISGLIIDSIISRISIEIMIGLMTGGLIGGLIGGILRWSSDAFAGNHY